MKRIAYVGVDYHVNSVSVAVLIEGASDFLDCIHIRNDDKMIRKYLKKLSKEYELRVCYEACSSGYVFQRKVKGWGYHCDVIAPSLIPRKLGDRRKNDYRDARNLAQNYRAGMLTVVHPPSEEEESIRAIIRCRFALKEAAKRTKQQINTFVLSQGHHWSKSKWSRQHRLWLTQIRVLLDSYLQLVFDEHLGHLEYEPERLIEEYKRDKAHGRTDVDKPENIDLDSPMNTWRAHRNEFFSQWIKFVHESTQY